MKADWIQAGKDVLRTEGAAGLKLDVLTRRLGMTTGAFYHHFSSFGDYLDATGELGNPDTAAGHLLDTIETMVRRRERRPLMLSNKAIASRLGLSPHTVRHYLERVFDKLEIHSRNSLVILLADIRDQGNTAEPLPGFIAPPGSNQDSPDPAGEAVSGAGAARGLTSLR